MKLIPGSLSLLNRLYLLIALLIIAALSVTAILRQHTKVQEQLYNKISNFHSPSIYYSAKLAVTLQDLVHILKNSDTSPDINSLSNKLRNPAYAIKNDNNAIAGLAKQTPDNTTKKAQQRLQIEVDYLLEILNNLSIANAEQFHQLPDMAKSVNLRAQQLNRLHTRANIKLRQRLADHVQNNTSLLTQLTVVIVIVGGLLIIPLLLNIRQTLHKLQLSEQQQREQRKLAVLEQSRMAALLSAMSIGILFEDKQGVIEYINPAFKRMWAINDDTPLIGHTLVELLKSLPDRFARPGHSSKFVLQALDTHEISECFEIDFNDGRILTQLSYPVFNTDKAVLGRLWVYEDITHERQTAQQLLHLAEHDHLTGLYNRHRFQKQLTFMTESCRRSKSKFALLYFDLDEFKFINDTFGHSAGDSVLLRTASEVGTLVREVETFARLGGDEFAILTLLNENDDISALPSRILNAVSSIPLRFRDSNLRLTASVGIAIYPDHGDNAEDLVAHADTAMYQAKNLGKNTWAVYNPEYNDSEIMVERMSWSRRIGLALEQNLLVLHFQGIYKTEDQQLNHLEVLVRMKDSTDPEQLIMPGSFIPFAEKTGQIVEIDRWVLDKSIALLAQYPKLPSLAVNISGRSFDEPSLPIYIRERLSHYAIDPTRLIIELTETETVSDLQDAQRFIEIIRQAGCEVCLDDFGSGFSTFTYLKYLDVKILKIDGLFIRDLTNNHENQVFVKAMVSIAQGLGKLIVAEFVEDEATLKLLKSFGVQLVQGYYLDYPTEQHEALLQQQKNLA
jgi:diguanylate cyclase (GGDEF)-like protein